MQLKLIHGQKAFKVISHRNFRAKGLATNKQLSASSTLMTQKCISATKNMIASFTVKLNVSHGPPPSSTNKALKKSLTQNPKYDILLGERVFIRARLI